VIAAPPPPPVPRLVAAPCAVAFTPPPAPVRWRVGGAGARWGEWRVQVGRPAIPVRLIVVPLDARRWRWTLDVRRVAGAVAPWRVQDVADSVGVAFNVGHFTDDGPWGWLVHDGRERQPPGVGPLAGAVVVTADGIVRLLDAGDIAAARGDPTVHEAFQSYPVLLDRSGALPAPLCRPTGGVDPTHRDIRFALGQRADGTVLLVLSRLDTDVPLADRTPVGPTVREMAWALRALGATRALLLDGGLSAQLLVRGPDGRVQAWPGLRAVPLGMVAVPRPDAAPPPPR
jgi:hypothetical protein